MWFRQSSWLSREICQVRALREHQTLSAGSAKQLYLSQFSDEYDQM